MIPGGGDQKNLDLNEAMKEEKKSTYRNKRKERENLRKKKKLETVE